MTKRRLGQVSRALDLCRFGLEPLLEAADSAGVTVGLANRARWFEIPEAGERAALLGDFAGAPLGCWHDTAAAHVQQMLGFGDALAPLAFGLPIVGASLTDASGLRGGLPWGTGEVAHAATLAALPTAALRVVAATADATDDELTAALQAVAVRT